ncbi:MAG: hypothetical protein BMS9Abin39_0651 [Ignavibacteria bacterium]|nr:MAG: hypothetical protein BMS9Abin39_0651 [Ignavibacteria bacterium]
MEVQKIAFLETYNLEDNGGVMGAILVTDADTKPIEFRVTAPIKPTSFQRTLYGDVLHEHILVELISVPLLNAINEQVDLIVVKDPFFLGANNKQGIRVVRIFHEGDGQSRKSSKSSELQFNSNGNGKTLLETSNKFESELPVIKEELNKLSEGRNLLEPFERLKLACEQVNQQKAVE